MCICITGNMRGLNGIMFNTVSNLPIKNKGGGFMPHVPSIILSSVKDCFICSGDSWFELPAHVPVALPMSNNREMFFSVWCSGSNEGITVPTFIRITAENGRFASVGGSMLIDWGDVAQVIVEPQIYKPYRPLPPRLIDSMDFFLRERRATAELYIDGGLRLALTPADGETFSFALGDGIDGSLKRMDVGSTVLLLVKFRTSTSEGLMLIDRNADVLLSVEGDHAELTEGYPTVYSDLKTVKGYQRRVRYEYLNGRFAEASNDIGFFTTTPRELLNNADRALCLVEELKLEKPEWKNLMSSELAAESTQNALAEFFGPYHHAAAYPVEEPEDRVTIGLFDGTNGIQRPRKFLFRFERGLVSDIEEL